MRAKNVFWSKTENGQVYICLAVKYKCFSRNKNSVGFLYAVLPTAQTLQNTLHSSFSSVVMHILYFYLRQERYVFHFCYF